MTLTAPRSGAANAVLGPTRGELRPDIQALRAIAVGSVLLFHLWPARLTGGYVGVDVFFVISGFLITSHLIREITLTGTVHLSRFWARRAKRLLPASLLVLLLISVAVVVVVPEAMWRQFLGEVIASALYVENWVLAANSVDYLAAENLASPTQHFWTLSAEEQFYVMLPLILLVTVALAGRRSAAPRRAIAWVLGAAVTSSFAYSVWLTATTPTVAYFSTFTRAWEFGAGALLALVVVEAGRRMAAVVPVVGVALIALSCVLYTSETPFPGAAAALPVLGALAVIWAGRHSIVARVGAFAPVALLGHISYAVYLWHWPLIVLVPFVTGRPLGTVDKVLILTATLLLAWASTRFVEEPVRFSPRLLGGRRRAVTVAAWSLVGMAIVVAVSATNLVALQQRDDARAAAIASVKSDTPKCLGAQAMDPLLRPCHNPVLDGVIVPDPAVAKSDDDNLPDCWGMAGPDRAKICTVAAPDGYSRHLLAVGDSHNNTLIGAYRAIAEAHGWRIDVAGMPGCYLTTAAQDHVSDQQRRACEAWRASVVEATWNTPIDALIVTHSTGDNIVLPGPGQTVESATVDGLVEAWRSVPPVPIIAIRDNPGMTRDTAGCVSRHALDAADACARPRGEALVFDGQAEAAKAVPSARVVDLTSFYCTETTCPPVIGNVLVYRDTRHVTATWTRTLTPYLDRAIVEQLGW